VKRKLRIGTVVCLASILLGSGFALSAYGQNVKIFAINVRKPTLHRAATPLLLTYDGTLPREQLYVRVFRESKEELMRRRPRPGDSCVLYAATQVYPVSVEGGTLRIDGLVEFFALRRERLQVLTLVFESGKNNISNGQLKLSPDEKGIQKYFEPAVEWPLSATDEQIATWRQMDALDTGRVYAAVISPTPPEPVVRDCSIVTVADYGAGKLPPGAEGGMPANLWAFAERASASCSGNLPRSAQQ
jgi:hypothetical protein